MDCGALSISDEVLMGKKVLVYPIIIHSSVISRPLAAAEKRLEEDDSDDSSQRHHGDHSQSRSRSPRMDPTGDGDRRRHPVHDRLGPLLGDSGCAQSGVRASSQGTIDDGALLPKEHKLKPTTVKLLGDQHIDELHLEEEEPPMDMQKRGIDSNPSFAFPSLESFLSSPIQTWWPALPPFSCEEESVDGSGQGSSYAFQVVADVGPGLRGYELEGKEAS
jgi:hypothetical protein